jgi:hypothetical protein
VPEFVDRQYIDDQHIVARYLADQLSDAEREAFEAYCRMNSAMYQELEAAARFKAGLAMLAEDGSLESLVAAGRTPQSSWALRRAAAIGGLLIGAGVMLAWALALRAPVMGSTASSVSGRFGDQLHASESYTIVRRREPIEVDMTIKAPKSSEAIWLRVLPDERGATAYESTLSMLAGNEPKIIGKAKNLAAAKDGFVSVFIRSASLPSGRYSLVISPEPSTGDKPTAFILEVRAE